MLSRERKVILLSLLEKKHFMEEKMKKMSLFHPREREKICYLHLREMKLQASALSEPRIM